MYEEEEKDTVLDYKISEKGSKVSSQIDWEPAGERLIDDSY